MQDCSLYLGKANLMQRIRKRGPQTVKIVKSLGKISVNILFGQICTGQNPRGNTVLHH